MSAVPRPALASPAESDPRLSALRARIARILPAPALAPAVLPTGIPALDRALAAGGLVRGGITALVGPAGAGVTTAWRTMVRAALAANARVAVVDATRTLAARDFAGLVPAHANGNANGNANGDRDRLVFVRPPDPATAPWCADLLLRSAAFALVVLDGAPPLTRAVAARLGQLARDADAALLLAGDATGPDTAPPDTRRRGTDGSAASVRLRVHPAPPSSPRPAITLLVEKGAASTRPVELPCVLPLPRRLCAHPEVPDRRGVARAPVGPAADPAAGAPVGDAAVRRGRRVAEPRYPRR